jgi:hypothetical protein
MGASKRSDGFLAPAASASARVSTTRGIAVDLSMNWRQDPVFTHNDNGVLEPGEPAMVVQLDGTHSPVRPPRTRP